MSPKLKRRRPSRPIFQGSRVYIRGGDPEAVGTVVSPVESARVSVHWDADGPNGAPQRCAVAKLVALAGSALAHDRTAARKRIEELLPVPKTKKTPRPREVRGGLPGLGKR